MVRLLPLLWLGCAPAEEAPVPEPAAERRSSEDPGDALVQRSEVDLLSRISLDLRGVRPSAEEIAQVEADPNALDSLTTSYLDDPRFGQQMMELYSEIYLTRADFFDANAADFGLVDDAAFTAAVGQEPLRMLAHIATEDLPYTELVTGDWTVANETLASIWPLDYPDGQTGWHRSQYTDGRPQAGALSTNGLWWRFTSTPSNANRGRANQVSRIFLCNDYLVREIAFDREVDLLDQEAIDDAIHNNEACVNCHASLDPLAAYLFGFWVYTEGSWYDMTRYHPDRERLYETYLGVSPSFYGQPGDSLTQLGQQIAADPRFVECAVSQVYTGLLKRDAQTVDADRLTAHREAFLAGGLTLKSLVQSVVQDPRYRAADTADPAIEALGATPAKLATPALLASQVADITGYEWYYSGYDMLGSDLYGVRTLAGGADGLTVTRNATEPNATVILVQERLAEAAASHVVAADQALAASDRRLFHLVDFTETHDSDPAVLTAQIQALHLRVFGKRVAPDGEEVAANLALWAELHAVSGEPGTAWAGLLSALLRDPDFLIY